MPLSEPLQKFPEFVELNKIIEELENYKTLITGEVYGGGLLYASTYIINFLGPAAPFVLVFAAIPSAFQAIFYEQKIKELTDFFNTVENTTKINQALYNSVISYLDIGMHTETYLLAEKLKNEGLLIEVYYLAIHGTEEQLIKKITDNNALLTLTSGNKPQLQSQAAGLRTHILSKHKDIIKDPKNFEVLNLYFKGFKTYEFCEGYLYKGIQMLGNAPTKMFSANNINRMRWLFSFFQENATEENLKAVATTAKNHLSSSPK